MKRIAKFWGYLILGLIFCFLISFINSLVYVKIFGGYPFSIMKFSVIMILFWLMLISVFLIPSNKKIGESLKTGLQFSAFICLAGGILSLNSFEEKQLKNNYEQSKRRYEFSKNRILEHSGSIDNHLDSYQIDSLTLIFVQANLLQICKDSIDINDEFINDTRRMIDSIDRYPFDYLNDELLDFKGTKIEYENAMKSKEFFENSKGDLDVLSFSLILASIILECCLLALSFGVNKE